MGRRDYILKLLAKPGAVLAPMAGITDYPMRKLCFQEGALWCVSEMVSSRAILYENQRTIQLAQVYADEGVVALQLFGSEPEVIYQAVSRMKDTKASMIDLNMGCPTPKIVKNGDGAALMQDLGLAGEVIAAARAATQLPLTVKMRSGWDFERINAPALAELAQRNGADGLAVHPRVRHQMYEGVPDWNVLKQVCQAVSIPVLASGNIHSAKEATWVMAQTGAAGVMVGRGSLGDPWVFSRIRDEMEGKVAKTPTIAQRVSKAREHLDLALRCGPEHVMVAEMRKHIAWYIKGIKGAAALRARTNNCTTAHELRELLLETEERAREEMLQGDPC